MRYSGKVTVAIILMIVLSLAGTTYAQSPQLEGGAAGGIIGGIAGALLDHRNPWRGGVIGAGLGAVAGATIADISARGSNEAAQSGRPVEYRIENGGGMYRAEPVGNPYYPDEYTRCRKVRERIWENDRLERNSVREICESEGTGGVETADFATPASYAMPMPPEVVLIPGTYVYAVPDISLTILFYHGQWWHKYRDHWYRSGHNNGPWQFVRYGNVPVVIRELLPDYPHMLHKGRRIAYGDVRDNWDRWERERHWDRHDAGRDARSDDRRDDHGRWEREREERRYFND